MGKKTPKVVNPQKTKSDGKNGVPSQKNKDAGGTATNKFTFSWPPSMFKTKVHPQKMHLENPDEGVFIIDNVLSPDECNALVDASKNFLQPTNPRNLPPKKGEAKRNNERFGLEKEDAEAQAFALKLWDERLKGLFLDLYVDHFGIRRGFMGADELVQSQKKSTPSVTSNQKDSNPNESKTDHHPEIESADDILLPTHINPAFRFYRYQKGMEFGPHVDEPVEEVGDSTKFASQFTLLLYIQADNLKGGETVFHGKRKDVAVEPKIGRLLAHWTGHDCRHSGAMVEKGVKMILRTDLFYRKS